MVIQLHISLPPSDCAMAFGRLEDKGASLVSSGSTQVPGPDRENPNQSSSPLPRNSQVMAGRVVWCHFSKISDRRSCIVGAQLHDDMMGLHENDRMSDAGLPLDVAVHTICVTATCK